MVQVAFSGKKRKKPSFKFYLFFKGDIEDKHALWLKFLPQTTFHLLPITLPELSCLNQTRQTNQTKSDQTKPDKGTKPDDQTKTNHIYISFVCHCYSCDWLSKPNQIWRYSPSACWLISWTFCPPASGDQIWNLEDAPSQNLPLSPHSLMLHNEGNLDEQNCETFFFGFLPPCFLSPDWSLPIVGSIRGYIYKIKFAVSKIQLKQRREKIGTEIISFTC